MWRKYSKHSAVYHTPNSIEKFKFVVSLRNIDSLIKVPKFDRGSDTQSLCDGDDLIEEVEIKWQEKIFSSEEIEVYSNADNCLNDVQKKYHKLLQKRKNVRHGIIFTYVDEDNFDLKDPLGFHTESRAVIPYELKRDAIGKEQTMYVFASLNPDTFLFSVRWKSTEKNLIVSPDFNTSEEDPYYIEIETDYRHLYSYLVRNTSKICETLTLAKITKSKKVDLMLPEIDRVFDMPPKRATRLSILLEIQSAVNFEYENIHVRYKVSLPERFALEEGDIIGSTHSSISRKSVWRFGYCTQFTIISATTVPLHENLVIHFEVISIDSWTRERSEGFGQLVLKLRPQKLSGTVPCYRIDYGLFDSIERYFIGGRKRFDLEKFSCGDGELLNRYGNRTISSGCLRLKCQIMRQKSVAVTKEIYLDEEFCGMNWDELIKRHNEARENLENCYNKS